MLARERKRRKHLRVGRLPRRKASGPLGKTMKISENSEQYWKLRFPKFARLQLMSVRPRVQGENTTSGLLGVSSRFRVTGHLVWVHHVGPSKNMLSLLAHKFALSRSSLGERMK